MGNHMWSNILPGTPPLRRLSCDLCGSFGTCPPSDVRRRKSAHVYSALHKASLARERDNRRRTRPVQTVRRPSTKPTKAQLAALIWISGRRSCWLEPYSRHSYVRTISGTAPFDSRMAHRLKDRGFVTIGRVPLIAEHAIRLTLEGFAAVKAAEKKAVPGLTSTGTTRAGNF